MTFNGASSSDQETADSSLSFAWRLTAPSGGFVNGSGITFTQTFTDDHIGEWTVRLTVTDAGGSTDVETGKPQDSRQSRYPGESNLAKDPQHAQQQPERGQNEAKQFGGTKGSSQQQGKQQGGNRDQQSQQDRDSKQGFEQGRHAGQANFEGGASGNQPHAPKGTKQQAQQPQAGGAKQHGDKYLAGGYFVQIGTAAAPSNRHATWNLQFSKPDGKSAPILIIVDANTGKVEQVLRN